MFARATSAPSFSKGMNFNKFCTLFTHRNPLRKLFALFLKASSKYFYCVVIVWQKIPGHGCLLSSFPFKIYNGQTQGAALWLMPWNSSLEAGVHHKSDSGVGIHSALQSHPLLTHGENYHILLSCSCQDDWTQLLLTWIQQRPKVSGKPSLHNTVCCF